VTLLGPAARQALIRAMSKKLYDVAEFNRQSFLGAIDKAVLNDTFGVFAGSLADWKSLPAHAEFFGIADVFRRFLVQLSHNPHMFLAGESELFRDTFDIWHTLGNIVSDEAASQMTHDSGSDRRFQDSLCEAHRSIFHSTYLFQSTSPRFQ
jgi:hypothetical protein